MPYKKTTDKARETKPAHYDLYVVRETDGDKNFWTKIGAAFVNRDGSFSLVFDALPVGGRVQMRLHEDREERED